MKTDWPYKLVVGSLDQKLMDNALPISRDTQFINELLINYMFSIEITF